MGASRRSKVLRDVLTSADRDKRKLLKIAGGCTIIRLLDGVSFRSPCEDAGGIPVVALTTATYPLGDASRPDRERLRPVQMQGLIVMLQLDAPAAASAATD